MRRTLMDIIEPSRESSGAGSTQEARLGRAKTVRSGDPFGHEGSLADGKRTFPSDWSQSFAIQEANSYGTHRPFGGHNLDWPAAPSGRAVDEDVERSFVGHRRPPELKYPVQDV